MGRKCTKMVLPDGTPKGMKMVLLERGVDAKGMNAEKMREKLNTHLDFSTQKNILEELVESEGLIINIFYVCIFRNTITNSTP